MNIRIPQHVNDRIDDIAVRVLIACEAPIAYGFCAWRVVATLPGIAADLAGDLRRAALRRR